MGDLEVSDPPAANRVASLEYKPDPPGGRVSVRGFRLLLALTLLNTTLLGASVMGPQLFPFLRQQWTQWQARRAAEKAEAQALQAALSFRQQAMTYTRPAGTVVYDEDPAEAARILRTGDTSYARMAGNFREAPPGWVPPVMAVTPKLFADFQASVFSATRPEWSEPLLFLHERTSPNGTKFVVAVQLHPRPGFGSSTSYDHASKKFRVVHRQAKQRALVVTAWPVGTAATPEPARKPQVKWTERAYQLRLPDTPEREVASRFADSRDGSEPAPVDYGNVLRFYAGVPDPADRSHFKLPYRLDGREGVIDGWIRDNAIELLARDGEWLFDAGDVLRLDAPPTRPTVYPPPAGR